MKKIHIRRLDFAPNLDDYKSLAQVEIFAHDYVMLFGYKKKIYFEVIFCNKEYYIEFAIPLTEAINARATTYIAVISINRYNIKPITHTVTKLFKQWTLNEINDLKSSN